MGCFFEGKDDTVLTEIITFLVGIIVDYSGGREKKKCNSRLFFYFSSFLFESSTFDTFYFFWGKIFQLQHVSGVLLLVRSVALKSQLFYSLISTTWLLLSHARLNLYIPEKHHFIFGEKATKPKNNMYQNSNVQFHQKKIAEHFLELNMTWLVVWFSGSLALSDIWEESWFTAGIWGSCKFC